MKDKLLFLQLGMYMYALLRFFTHIGHHRAPNRQVLTGHLFYVYEGVQVHPNLPGSLSPLNYFSKSLLIVGVNHTDRIPSRPHVN